jgi:hypothetical protein
MEPSPTYDGAQVRENVKECNRQNDLTGFGGREMLRSRPSHREPSNVYHTSLQRTGSALEPMVRKFEYRGKFGAGDRAALLGLPHIVRSIENQHYIIRERDRATHCCLMLSGFSVRHKIVAGGHRQIVAIQMKGEMVDLQNCLLENADHSVQC